MLRAKGYLVNYMHINRKMHFVLSMKNSKIFLRGVMKTAEVIFERFAKMSGKCEELKSEINNRETN